MKDEGPFQNFPPSHVFHTSGPGKHTGSDFISHKKKKKTLIIRYPTSKGEKIPSPKVKVSKQHAEITLQYGEEKSSALDFYIRFLPLQRSGVGGLEGEGEGRKGENVEGEEGERGEGVSIYVQRKLNSQLCRKKCTKLKVSFSACSFFFPSFH